MKIKLSVRNIVAIALMALTIVFMFWPSVLGRASLSETRSMLSDLRPFMDGFPKFLSVVLSIGFFAMIILAALSIVVMLINQTKAAVVAHTVVTLIVTVVLIIFMIKLEGTPSAALFLLPIFSIASTVAYQPEK